MWRLEPGNAPVVFDLKRLHTTTMSSLYHRSSWIGLGVALAIRFLWVFVEKPLIEREAKQVSSSSSPGEGLSKAQHDRILHSLGIGLLGAALVYVAFAIVWGTSFNDLVLELAGCPVYGAFYLVAMLRKDPLWLAAGWCLHPMWDVFLHLGNDAPGKHMAPEWYVWACISFDVVVAIDIVYRRNELMELGSIEQKRK